MSAPYVIDHFAQKYTLLRRDDSLFQTVSDTEPAPLDEPITLPEVTESDFAAFDALQSGSQALEEKPRILAGWGVDA